MTDIVAGVITNISTDWAKSGINKARYLCCFNDIVEDFEKRQEDLVAKLNTVGEDVRRARERTEKISTEVEHWQNKAKKQIGAHTKTKERCFYGWFPNCIWLYSRGRNLERKKQEIMELIEKCNFHTFSRPSKGPDIERFSVGGFVPFESRDQAYNELLKSLKDGSHYMIGLHGMPGNGKTTLAIEVGNKVKELKLFDYVVMVVVSNGPNIVKKIQDQIASELNLGWDNGNESGRPTKLWKRLTDEDKILIILDDVWDREELKFEEIGIPVPGNQQKSCYVLLTTRDREVCRKMGCQLIIPLDVLREHEAWTLFKNCAALGQNSSKTKRNKGKKIAKLCKGLPLAIATIASILKNEEENEWDVALRSLNKTVRNIDRDLERVYRTLEVSYKCLKSEAKELFKLCSAFPEDYEICMEDLTIFGIGLGLCGEVNSYGDARDAVHKSLKKLTDSCFLSSVRKGEFVKMHDLVRDAAHCIANKTIQVVMDPGSLKTLQEDGRVKSKLKYLYCHSENDLPEQWDCPKIELLILECGYQLESLTIPDTFFKGMRDLKVCALNGFSKYCDIFLPKSVESLNNLKALSLREFKLDDLSVLEKLESLESLELKVCRINELPKGVVKLKRLKLLRLTYCTFKKSPFDEKSPFEVINKLSQLEELYLVGNTLPYSQVGIDDVAIPSLQRYHIDLVDGEGLQNSVNGSRSRALSIACFDSSTSNATTKNIVQGAEVLHLYQLQGGSATITPHFVEAIGEMNDLIELKLNSCSEIMYLIDSEVLSSPQETLFSNIAKLLLKDLANLEQLCHCHGLPPPEFFENLQELVIEKCLQLNFRAFPGNLKLSTLKILRVKECPRLTSLFTLVTARSLDLLQELKIGKCESLKYIIREESDEGKGKEIVADDDDNQMRSFLLFPKVEILQIDSCQQLEQILSIGLNKRRLLKHIPPLELPVMDSQQTRPVDIAVHIKKMKLIECEKLTLLFNLSIVRTILLEELTIEGCHGLKHIITDDRDGENHMNYSPILKELKILYLEDCSNLIHVIGEYHHESHLSALDVFPALEELSLRDMPNIKSIYPNNDQPRWSALRELYLIECPQFCITTVSDFKDFEENMKQAHNLNDLRIINNSKLKGIICLEGNSVIGRLGIEALYLHNLADLSYAFSGPKHILSLANLCVLEIEGCGKLKFIFSTTVLRSLPQLERLAILNCEALEQIVEEDHENQNLSNPDNFQEVYFPELQSVYVINCRKLKRLFWMNSPREFPKLWALFIVEASNLEEVFGSSEKGETEKQVENVLPELAHLILLELPSLANFCQWTRLHNVREILVLNCPKLSLTSTVTLQQIIIGEYQQEVQIYSEFGGDRRFGGLWICDLALKELNRLKIHEGPQSESEGTSERELHSSQSTMKTGIDIVEKVCAPGVPPATSSSTDLQVTKIPSTSTSTAHLGETTSDGQPQATGETKSIKGKVEDVIVSKEGANLSSTTPDLISGVSESGPQDLAEEGLTEQALEKSKRTNETAQTLDKNPDLPQKTSLQSINGGIQEIPMLQKASMHDHEKSPESISGSPQRGSSLDSKPDTLVIPQHEFVEKGSNELVSLDSLEENISAIETSERLENSLETSLQGSMRVSKIETYLDQDTIASSSNLQDLMDGVVSVLDSIEEDDEVQEPIPSEISYDHINLDDHQLLAKAFIGLEAYLKMSLKDIANSEVSSHCLENALKFLSS